MTHPGNAELNELIDAGGDPALAAHVAACHACRRRLDRLREVDAALRQMPAVRAPAEFTARTMERLARLAAPSFAWSVLRNLAPLLALTAVLTGIFLVLEAGAGPSAPTAQAATQISGWFSDAMAAVRPYLHGMSYGPAAAALVLIVAVGVLDRYVLMRLRRR